MKNKLYMLIGVPGSGKSTWLKSQTWANDCVVVSTDNLIEAHAAGLNKTYNDVFDSYIKQATKIMHESIEHAREAGQDIIWDQTNVTAKSRAKKLAMLPNHYAIAVVFKTPPKDELAQRLNSRPGKTIPWNIMEGMISTFELPTEEEGFKEIWYAS